MLSASPITVMTRTATDTDTTDIITRNTMIITGTTDFLNLSGRASDKPSSSSLVFLVVIFQWNKYFSCYTFVQLFYISWNEKRNRRVTNQIPVLNDFKNVQKMHIFIVTVELFPW